MRCAPKIRALKAQPACERGFSYIPVGTKAGYAGDMRAACGADNAAFVDADGTLVVAAGGVEHRARHDVRAEDQGLPQRGQRPRRRRGRPRPGGRRRRRARTGCARSRRSSTASSRAAPSAAPPATTTPRRPTSTPRSRPSRRSPRRARSSCSAATTRAPTSRPWWRRRTRHARAVVCFGAAGQRFADAFRRGRRRGAGRLRDPARFQCSPTRSTRALRPGGRGRCRSCCRPPARRSTSSAASRSADEVFKSLVAERAARLGA